MLKTRKNQKGFTLTELIIVIVIIGILAIASVSASEINNDATLDDASDVDLLQNNNKPEVIAVDEVPDVPDLFVNSTVYVNPNNIDDYYYRIKFES